MRVYRPKPGYISNPLSEGKARNMACFCGSLKKAKKCCGKHMYVKEDFAKKARIYVDAYSHLSFAEIKEHQIAALEAAKKEEAAREQIKESQDGDD